MRKLVLLSPAKINLFLNVLKRRSDGYHSLETFFERISLADTVVLRRLPSGIRVTSDSSKVPSGTHNTATRAATLLAERFKIKKGVHIHIVKRIPIAAGLGGGSSNAASVLLGLNRLWRLGLSKKTLLKLGSQIGSDVPFFILETPFATGRGRGEVLKKVSARGLKIWHCLVKPPFGISTKQAYRTLRLPSLTPQKSDVKMLLRSLQKGDWKPLSKLLVNSLESSPNKRLKTILKIKEELRDRGAVAALMSGSGSSVFGIFRSKKEAYKAARFFKRQRKNYEVFIASTF